ncbi:hypothetical protein IQ06DRAFT_347277 [Phaeosphaeriaceae sp. SRC1lsM3a]|nr:hypothetical protein IQ06DRAFT_347277 [Stagonospora sp. SRC1lsM3a]
MSVKRFAAFAMTIPPKALHFLNIVVLTRADAAMTLDRDVRLAYDSVPEQATYEAAQQWEPPEDLIKIAKICHAHPNIEVRFVLPEFHFSNTQPDEAALRFLVRGIGWAYSIRRQELDNAILSHLRVRAWFQLVCARSPLWLHLAAEKPTEKLKLRAAVSQDIPSASSAILSTTSTAANGTRTGIEYTSLYSEECKLLRVPNFKFVPCCTAFDEAGFRTKLLQSQLSADRVTADLSNILLSGNGLDNWVTMARGWVEHGI